jgi:cobalt-zinc-cadmium resistance protein CzcA
MVHKIITWALNNPLVVILLAVALAAVGVYSFLHVNVEAYPDPAPAIIEVVAQFPGASAEEVERQVTIPLEVTLAGMPGLKFCRTKSLFGLAHLRNQFEYGYDYNAARQEVINRLQFTQALPPGVTPQLSPESPTGEIFRYTLRSPKDASGRDVYTLNDLKALQDWVLEREFRRVPRIIDVSSSGGTVKRYEIHLDPDRLRQLGITLQQVQAALQSANANVGGDYVIQGDVAMNVRSVGLFGGGLDPVGQVLGMDKQVLEAYQDARLAEAAGIIEKGSSRDLWPLLAQRRTTPAWAGRSGAGSREALAAHEPEAGAVRTVERLCRAAADQKVDPPLEGREHEQADALRRLRTALAGEPVTPPLNEQEHNTVRAVGRVIARACAQEVKPPLSEQEQSEVHALEQWMSTRAAARLREEENKRILEIRKLVLTSINNKEILLEDVVEGGRLSEGQPPGQRGVVVGHQTRLGRVGQSRALERETPTGIYRVADASGKLLWRDEDEKVQCIVLLRKGEDSLPALKAVEEKVAELNNPASGKMLPGVRIEPYYDRTELIDVTTETVKENLLIGITLVVAILFMFLSNVRTALIVAINIPLALLFAFSMLFLRGKSANLLSIGAVDFGIIVDSSVIMIENVYRHLATGEHAELPLKERILRASREIEKPLLFSTLIMVCAFLPLFTMRGPEGQLFGPMADTYAFALAGALVLAVTLTPVLALLLFRDFQPVPDNILVRSLRNSYLRQLRRCLKYRWTTIGVMTALMAGTVVLMVLLGREFMPELEEGNLWIRATFPLNTALERVGDNCSKARAIMSAYPEVESVVTMLGRPDDGTDPTGFYNAEFFVPLRPQAKWPQVLQQRGWRRWLFGARRPRSKLELVNQMNEELTRKLVGADWNFSQNIRDNVMESLSGIKGDNSVKIFGPDLNELEKLADRVRNRLRAMRDEGIENVGVFNIMGQTNLEFRVDLDKCKRWGVSAADVNNVVQTALGGKAFATMIEGEKTFDVAVRWPAWRRGSETSILDIPVDVSNNQVLLASGPGLNPSPTGSGLAPPARVGSLTDTSNPISSTPRLRLRDLVSAVGPDGRPDPGGSFERAGASTIYREQGKRLIAVKFSVRGRDLAGAVAAARERTRDIVRAPYQAVWSGEFEEMEDAERRLMVIIPLSLTLIFILLYMAFRSLLDTVVVLSNVLALLMGGIWALWLTRTNFSISAAVGFVSLFGVAIMDGLLLISSFNANRAHGMPLDEAILQGASKRVRAVIMTALTAILGLLPAALSTRIGAQTQRPLAIVVVGGMITTLFLTRYLMPVLYSFYGHREPPAGSGSLAH